MRATVFRTILLMAILAIGHTPRVLAADEPEGGIAKALPDWFNRQAREYFTMPAFVVPVIQGNDVTRQVTFLVTLETMGSANREKLMDKRPQLQDGFLRDLYGVIAVRPDADVYDSTVLKTRLQRVSERVLGTGIVDNILINVTYRRVASETLSR
ncbi:MAG TPA: hypothetical protein VL966_03880 [Alphaproteobacteria bacterium]|nr:hypothetical protein [Alphaproteobacteria bacterium]